MTFAIGKERFWSGDRDEDVAAFRGRGRRSEGDAEAINLWAGQAHRLAQARPTGEIVRAFGRDARAAVADAAERLGAETRSSRSSGSSRRNA